MTMRLSTRQRIGLGLDRVDATLVRFMADHGLRWLRLAIALVYLWFGGLKLIDASPAGELVVKTVFWLPTLEGQYAFKNIILITAGLVIGSTVRQNRPRHAVAE